MLYKYKHKEWTWGSCIYKKTVDKYFTDRYILEIPTIDPQQEVKIIKVHPMGIYIKLVDWMWIVENCLLHLSSVCYNWIFIKAKNLRHHSCPLLAQLSSQFQATFYFWLQFTCTWSGPMFQNLDVFGRWIVHCTASSNNLAWHCSKYSFLNGPEACLYHCFTFRWVFSLSWVLISSVLVSWTDSWEM